VPEMSEYMRGHSDYYFDTVAAFGAAVLQGE
jgi:hypothetical protein